MTEFKYTLPMIEELKKCLLDNSYFSKKYFDIDVPQVSDRSMTEMSDEQAKVFMLWSSIFITITSILLSWRLTFEPRTTSPTSSE